MGSPRSSAAYCVCTVAVPIPISCAELATIAVPSALIRTRASRNHAVHRIGAGGHALPDQPCAVALRTNCRGTILPSKLFRAETVGFAHVAAGKRISANRIFLGLIPHTKLDRIKASLVGESIHGAFHSERADRFARCAHKGVRNAIDFANQLANPISGHRVQMPRRKTELFRKIVVGGLRGHAFMDKRRDVAGCVRRNCHALLGWRAASDEPENALPA